MHYFWPCYLLVCFSTINENTGFRSAEGQELFQQCFCVFTGWIRYSERVLGSLVTPHICTARSPQQIMGCLVKDYFSKQQVSVYCHPNRMRPSSSLTSSVYSSWTEIWGEILSPISQKIRIISPIRWVGIMYSILSTKVAQLCPVQMLTK